MLAVEADQLEHHRLAMVEQEHSKRLAATPFWLAATFAKPVDEHELESYLYFVFARMLEG